jgi:uncharacterized membrane protein YciS (DUF1049 family)
VKQIRTDSSSQSLESPEESIVIIKNHLTQAYAQAPWRLRTQKGALFLIGVFLVGCVIWVMLTISVKASESGLDIQVMTAEEQVLVREIANLRSQIAEKTSSTHIKEQAAVMGFHQATREDITFIVVPGYVGRRTNISAPPPGSDLPPLLLKSTYTQSLYEWLYEGALKISEKPGRLEK